MSELNGGGLRHYSELGFGESLSKIARHELALLCLKAVRDELDHKPIQNKSRGRGRPKSQIGVLALRMGVHPDSVKRWMRLKEVQASDMNTEKLATMAFKYSPEKVVQILKEDIARRQETMDVWLTETEASNPIRPYAENTDCEEGA